MENSQFRKIVKTEIRWFGNVFMTNAFAYYSIYFNEILFIYSRHYVDSLTSKTSSLILSCLNALEVVRIAKLREAIRVICWV